MNYLFFYLKTLKIDNIYSVVFVKNLHDLATLIADLSQGNYEKELSAVISGSSLFCIFIRVYSLMARLLVSSINRINVEGFVNM